MALRRVVPIAGVAGLATYVLRGGPRLPPDTDAIIERVSRGDLSHVVAGATGFADSSGVRIWYENIPPTGAQRGVVLLNSPMAGDALFWSPGFIRTLSGAGYRVVRYDQRGTGASDWIENWSRKAPYTLVEMAGDAVAVLDAVAVERAHVVGFSLGGFVAQELAIAHPDRVASLTLMSTSADPTDGSLPGPRVGWFLMSALGRLPLLRYRLRGGEQNLARQRVAGWIAFCGDDSLDVGELAEVVLYDLRERRGVNRRAVIQHHAAVTATRSRYQRLAALTAPTLVVHGTADPILPIDHGQKLSEVIPWAQHLWLEDIGHQFPYPRRLGVVDAVIAHLDQAS